MTDYIINNYSLNEKISDVLPAILLIGLPVSIFLTWYLSSGKGELKEKVDNSVSDRKSYGILITIRKKTWFSIPGVIVLVLLEIIRKFSTP